jgi:hypothetical protein
MIGYVILIGVILIQIVVIGILIDEWNHLEKDNKEYFKKIRREYDIKVEGYREDIAARDEIINGYRNMLKDKVS